MWHQIPGVYLKQDSTLKEHQVRKYTNLVPYMYNPLDTKEELLRFL